MLNRRAICTCLALGGVALMCPSRALASSCDVITPDVQRAISPADAIARLKAGNARFVSGKVQNCDRIAQAKQVSGKQAPYAVVVSCLDSRASPEIVFDQGPGDIFAARIAGNFVNRDIVGSIEFATAVVGASAVVIAGHTNCGAIKGAIDNVRVGNLTATLANIRPVLERVEVDGPRTSENPAFVQAVTEANVRHAAALLLSTSDIVRERVEAGKLLIKAAVQDLGSGEVRFL